MQAEPPEIARSEGPTSSLDYERIEQIVRTVVEETTKRELDLATVLQQLAVRDSARFVTAHIPLHLGKSHYDLRRDAVLAAPADGLFTEFGVWTGNWLRQLAAMRPVDFYGFDSFEGLPEAWSLHGAGTFDVAGELPSMPDNVTLVKGWFADTLPRFLDENAEPVAFVHVD